MIRWLAFLLTFLLAVPASAHLQKAAITLVEHNARSGMVEVVHRIPLHDAEHALKRQGDPAPDVIDDLESRRAFARYAAERFSITVDGEKLDLTILGTEIEGGSLLIYQEGPSPGAGTEVTVQSLVLTEVWARQINSVNIGSGTSPQTLVFSAGDQPKAAILR